MDFSNFLDLYVLEDSVYVDNAADSVDLADFHRDSQSPIRVLPDPLCGAVFGVSDSTREIYDQAPTEYTFDMGSYDYWLTLSKEDKAKIPQRRTEGMDYWSRDYLLFSSKWLDLRINDVLEQLAQTRFTVMPSFRNLVPFLSSFHQIDTPAMQAYRQVATYHRVATDKVLSMIRPRQVYLPPLLSLLLARSDDRPQLVPRMIEMRREFAGFRSAMAEWLGRLDGAQSLREKVEITKELDSANEALVKSFQNRRVGFYKELAGMVIDAAEEGSLTKMVTKPVFKLLKAGLTTFLPERFALRRYTGMVDLMDKVLDINDYSRLLERVFGDSLDISQRELTHARHYREKLISTYKLEIPGPG
jgi:hypothetical protein